MLNIHTNISGEEEPFPWSGVMLQEQGLSSQSLLSPFLGLSCLPSVLRRKDIRGGSGEVASGSAVSVGGARNPFSRQGVYPVTPTQTMSRAPHTCNAGFLEFHSSTPEGMARPRASPSRCASGAGVHACQSVNPLLCTAVCRGPAPW